MKSESTHYNRIVIHYGEIALKGKNQPNFLYRLKQNIQLKLKSLGVSWSVRETHSYMYIDIPEDAPVDHQEIQSALQQVMGIAWFGFTTFIPHNQVYVASGEPNYQRLENQLVAQASEHFVSQGKFCVRVNRADKQFPSTSPKLERRFGAEIIEKTKWDSVDLKSPDITFRVDIYIDGVYFYTKKIEGSRGLPVGITGRVLVLLSGGIDSPVAAYLAAKRGCSVDFIHFTANQMQLANAQGYKVSQLAQRLSRYTDYSKLYLVPYTHFEFAALSDSLEYELVIFRRFMTRVAEKLAIKTKAQALVTGDNLAQVASQTLENIVANNQAVQLPILRPLLTYDKYEIVDLAKHISTYSLSIEPYKDCCSLISEHPRTKSDHDTLTQIEDKTFPDYEELITRTLDDAVSLTYRNGRLDEN